jgi:DNA-binding LacI/PurR family transcriptional regulator
MQMAVSGRRKALGDAPRARRATSLDVARLAGVSQAAVSRVFTPGSSVSEAMRQAVLAAARQLNYVPNTLASNLSRQRSNIVALMIGDTRNSAYSDLLTHACRHLERIGKHVLLFISPDPAKFDDILLEMLRYQVDAIVIAAASMSSRMAGLCLDRGVPVIMLARQVPNLPVHNVLCDDAHGGGEAARVLFQGGGQSFAAIHGPPDTSTTRDRLQGYLDRLERLGVEPAEVARAGGDYTYEGGYRAALELMRGPKPPDSIFCLTDLMALGAMDAVRSELGLRVPHDVAIFGFDDIDEASRAAYAISTIREPFTPMMEEMVRLITQDPATEPEPVLVRIKGELVLRGSTRPLP